MRSHLQDTADLAGGRPAGHWHGTTEILQQWMDSGQTVRWAQCWVFSLTLTTVARALGLPTRSVTNYESAHDVHSNRMVDYIWRLDAHSSAFQSGGRRRRLWRVASR